MISKIRIEENNIHFEARSCLLMSNWATDTTHRKAISLSLHYSTTSYTITFHNQKLVTHLVHIVPAFVQRSCACCRRFTSNIHMFCALPRCFLFRRWPWAAPSSRRLRRSGRTGSPHCSSSRRSAWC